MNEHDLLNAFQNVDPAFLEECEQMKAAAEQTAQQKQSPEAVRAITMKQNTLWNRLTGAAAVIAVFSIAAAGFAAIRPNRGAVANQPAETAMTETGETTPAAENAASTAPAEDSAQDIPATTVTALPLPSDEFVEETVPQEKLLSLNDEDAFSHSYSCGLKKTNTPYSDYYELDAAGTLESFYLSLRTEILFHSSNKEALSGTLPARVVMIQDGEYLPFALNETDTPALWQDITISIGKINLKTVWLTPEHRNEYSRLAAVVTLNPEYNPADAPADRPDAMDILSRTEMLGICMLHAADVPGTVHEEQYPAASDYIDFPEISLNNSLFEGMEVGRKMDYEANIPNKYEIYTNSWDGSTVLPRDELYLKMHIKQDTSLYSSWLLMDGAYVNVLCDGKPAKVFDGRYQLLIDTPDPAKTLNYHLTPDDSVPEGLHRFSPVMIGRWNQPRPDSHGFLYFYAPQSSYLTVE